MKILINVPTNRPEYFKEFHESLIKCSEFYRVSDIHAIIQEPWTIDDMCLYPDVIFQPAIKSVLPSMLDLRRHSIDYAIKNYYNYILLADDDWIWNNCDFFYSSIARYLDTRSPSVVSVYGNSHKNQHILTTNRGLFVRPHCLKDFDAPYDLLGGCEEAVIALHALNHTPYRTTIHGSPLQRRDKKHFDDPSSPMHNRQLCEDNCLKFIKEKYNDPNWDILSGKLPGELEEKVNAHSAKN